MLRSRIFVSKENFSVVKTDAIMMPCKKSQFELKMFKYILYKCIAKKIGG